MLHDEELSHYYGNYNKFMTRCHTWVPIEINMVWRKALLKSYNIEKDTAISSCVFVYPLEFQSYFVKKNENVQMNLGDIAWEGIFIPIVISGWRMLYFISLRVYDHHSISWCCSGLHDDAIKWKHFPHYWSFVQGIHRWPVKSPLKGQWRGALKFSLICTWTKGCANNRVAGDLRCHRGHNDVIVMSFLYTLDSDFIYRYICILK